MLAVIGGSGLYQLEELRQPVRLSIETPWGAPSDTLTRGAWGAREVLFIARHARDHRVPPHRINYRANIWALREAGASQIIAVAAVGGIAPECSPGMLVLPDQLIDYTSGREATFFDGTENSVVHVDFTEPYDARLRAALASGARRLGLPLIEGGVYGCTNGPRLETAAEIGRMGRDGCTLVGMTGMPEAALARELGLPYACLAVVANAAAGLAASSESVSIDAIMATLAQSMGDVRRLLAALCEAQTALTG
jgi:5'-deoxy-5'-methylthioadenosine phosphorylase